MRKRFMRLAGVTAIGCGMALVIVSSGIVAEADCGPETTVSPATCKPAHYVEWETYGACDPWLWWCYDNAQNPCSAATGQGFPVDGVCEMIISGSTYSDCTTGVNIAIFDTHPMNSQCVVENYICKCKTYPDLTLTVPVGACDCW